jgi:hypothetical protein
LAVTDSLSTTSETEKLLVGQLLEQELPLLDGLKSHSQVVSSA